MAARGNTKRLEKELSDMREKNKDKNATVLADSEGGNICQWLGVIHGPEDTPYFGGYYELEIEVPSQYPYEPPKIKFRTKIYHPNISSQTGVICLDILGKE